MYTGLTGALKFIGALGETPIAYISGWNVEGKAEMIESNKMGQVDRRVAAGFRSWSAGADGAVSFENTVGYDNLYARYYKGQKITFYFYLNDGASGENTYFRGEGYIESLSVDLTAEDKGNISIGVAGTGPLELYVGDKIVSGKQYADEKTLKFSVGDDGSLHAEVPDVFADAVWLEDGRLAVRLI